MQGYTVLVQEMLDQARDIALPTHLFVPGGVGGLAAAVAAHLSELLTTDKPRIIVVEPHEADCIYQSIAVGELTNSAGSMDTFMACLSAGEVSPLAWTVLRAHVEDVLTLPDVAARDAMCILAEGIAGDPPVVAGESGVAAIAGAIAAALDPVLRSELKLDENSIVVTIGSEGATDADTYERVVGKSAGQVEVAA
jgi:diaminopropionate ammonia-lyase